MSTAEGTAAGTAADTAAGAAEGTPDGTPDGTAAPVRRTTLYDRHVELGAKLADFSGWEMPIEYAGGGVLREHEAVRGRVGLFDVSHLGKVGIRGPGAADFVDACLTNALARIGPGRAQYSLCCDGATGGVVDDLIVYLRGADEVLLVPNAANTAEVTRRLAAVAPEGVVVRDEHEEFAVLAVQGPLADEVLDAVNLPVGQPYMSFVDATWEGAPVTVCRTGYTGERGYEVLPPAELAPPLWDGLLERVRMLGGLPCGLGARDTLRTEMGYPLHGHELSLEITPVQARVGWAVGWSKPAFWGREVLQAERARGADRLLWGVLALERGVPRPGLPVVAAEGGEGSEGGEATGRLQAAERGGAGAVAGERVGVITSGTFSPTLRQGIGLALLGRSIAEGDEVVVDVRGRPLRCRVGRPPFVSSRPT